MPYVCVNILAMRQKVVISTLPPFSDLSLDWGKQESTRREGTCQEGPLRRLPQLSHNKEL